ncbi:hypothetical protein D3C86_1136150 [compost metagenome]
MTEDDCLYLVRVERHRRLHCVLHFEFGSDGQSRVLAYADRKLHGRNIAVFIARNVLANFSFDASEVVEVVAQLFGHPHASKIAVAGSVTKPPPHLQQRVICRSGADEEADRQTL